MTAAEAILAASIVSSAGIKDSVWSGVGKETFSITGTVTAVIAGNSSFSVYDGLDDCYLRSTNAIAFKAGDFGHFDGRIGVDANGWRRAFLDSAVITGVAGIPESPEIDAAELADAAYDSKVVAIRGIVADVKRDDIAPEWLFITLRSPKGSFVAAVFAPEAGEGASIPRLLGAEVRLSGIANVLPDGGKRKFKMPQITLPSPESVQILAPAPKSPLDAPEIEFDANGIANGQYKSPALISQMGMRRVVGTVLAVERRRNVILSVGGSQIASAALDDKERVPSVGEEVVVAGFPDTDLFILKLSKARWERSGDPSERHADEKVWDLPETMLEDEVLREHYGHLVRMKCRVLAVSEEEPSTGASPPGMVVMFGESIVPVDVGAAPQLVETLSPGDTIEVRGICVLNTSDWNLGNVFPGINGFSVILRGGGDVRVLRPAQWWTPGRLKLAVAALLAVSLLLLCCIWFLRKAVLRKSRQLFKAEIGKVETELRISERTRLAVEIHDSVSQHLVGVSYQLDAAAKSLRRDADASGRFLSTAQKVLVSCREELRRCLSDLRGNALEMADMAEAIRTTLAGVLHDAELSVRFNVRRERLSDTTAHAILCIVRELASNAVRHGRAKHVAVAGAGDGTAIVFSVRDDGSGFDVAKRPGPAEGHFGLQGVSERVAKLGGVLRIESEPGRGSHIYVRMEK